MGTITFEVHPITHTSPSIHACNHIKSILIFLLFIFFLHIFLFKQIMNGHIRDRKEIPNYVKLLTFRFCYAEAHKCHWHWTFAMSKYTDVISWLAGNSDEMVIYAFLLGVLPIKKSDVLSTRDHLILLITNKSHKAHLLSYAWRCSSKLQRYKV